MTNQNNKWTRIAAYLANEMNDKQQEEFLLEIQENQLLKNDYVLMKNTWKQFDANPNEEYKDTVNAWNSLRMRMQSDGMVAEENSLTRIQRTHYFLRIAAVIVMILAVGIPTVFFSLQNAPGVVVEHSSMEGVLTVDLPDGSRVFLNEGSTLNYNKSFEENRKVKLKGEGFFNVMSDPQRPFNVHSGKVIVTVLGTSFNVKESLEENNVEVFVESGFVTVSMNDINESITLEPGQMGTATNRLTTTAQENENYLSWKTKDFKFVDESIEDILGVLTRAYHVEVNTEDLSLVDMRLTSTYNDQSFDAILSTICLALNMDYKKEGKVYILHSK